MRHHMAQPPFDFSAAKTKVGTLMNLEELSNQGGGDCWSRPFCIWMFPQHGPALIPAAISSAGLLRPFGASETRAYLISKTLEEGSWQADR